MKRLLGIFMMVHLLSGMSYGDLFGPTIEVVKKTHPLTQQVFEEYECYRDEDTNKPIKHGYWPIPGVGQNGHFPSLFGKRRPRLCVRSLAGRRRDERIIQKRP